MRLRTKTLLQMFNPFPTFDWNVLLFDNVDPLVSQ